MTDPAFKLAHSATRLALSASILLFAGCGASSSTRIGTPDQQALIDAAAPERLVRFLAFGDAGRGNASQYAVAQAMEQVCAHRGCDFALELGDNFYANGVSSVNDEQWQSKFEQPYKNLHIPFYPALGNHDNSSLSGGDGNDNARGDVQVQYSSANAPGSSGKWRMPARYHAFTAPLDLKPGETPIAEFFVLDSNPLAARNEDRHNLQYQLPGYAASQLKWLQGAMQNSRAKWTIALAHHPYISNGGHGNAGTFDGRPAEQPGTANGKPWKDFLEASICDSRYRGGVDLFLFGHDHDLEWLKPADSCNGKTEFILSGAGADPRHFGNAQRNPHYWQKDQSSGFFWLELSATAMRGEAYVLVDGRLPLDAAGKPKPAYCKPGPCPE